MQEKAKDGLKLTTNRKHKDKIVKKNKQSIKKNEKKLPARMFGCSYDTAPLCLHRPPPYPINWHPHLPGATHAARNCAHGTVNPTFCTHTRT